MKHSSPDVNNIFTGEIDFAATALNFFDRQYAENTVYRHWCNLINKKDNVETLQQIAYLPISFFKTHDIKSGFFEPQITFSSSGTTQTINSNHYVKDVSVYEESFIKAFELFYGDIKDWCIIGLLPAYLERKGSSLVYMVDKLIGLSNHSFSGFYLDEFDKLADVLRQTESNGQKVLLIGVTFALLDFAEQHPMQLRHTTIMETGGMKGRRRELTRQEVHHLLHEGLGVTSVHSEYGMTELLSQAYSKGEGRFICPPWMKILVRDEEDPFLVKSSGRGIINVIDLANIDSCCFIATDDVGIVYEDGSFEVWGRLDNSDIRGCSLLVV